MRYVVDINGFANLFLSFTKYDSALLFLEFYKKYISDCDKLTIIPLIVGDNYITKNSCFFDKLMFLYNNNKEWLENEN